MIKGLFEI